MLTLIKCMGMWPGPSIITWTSCFRRPWQLAKGLQLRELGASLASAIEPGRRPSPRLRPRRRPS